MAQCYDHLLLFSEDMGQILCMAQLPAPLVLEDPVPSNSQKYLKTFLFFKATQAGKIAWLEQ